uniref:M3 family metallopeptidase n=1 Tax=Sphingomonas bacterium TaxID=1895847 RepID=UPI0020C63F97
MNRLTTLGAAALAITAANCLTSAARGQAAPGPFAAESDLPFHAPRFDRIRDGDYQPAMERGMADQLAEIRRIAADPAPPTFDNTIVAMERSGRMLDRVQHVFSAVVQANTDPVLDKVQAQEAPRLAQHEDAIYLDPRLFARVHAVWAGRDALTGPEQRQLAEVIHQRFIRAGAQLSDPDKATLRALNTQLSTLETTFQQKLLAAGKAGALVVGDEADLAGLDAGAVAAAAQAGKDRGLDGRYVLPLQNTTQQPPLGSMANRATREALFERGWTRAERGDANDTRATIARIAQLRARKAALLGFPSWADYVLADQMARTPAA